MNSLNQFLHRFDYLAAYAPVVLRLGLTAVYAWFGVSQLVNTSIWTSLVPSWVTDTFGISAVMMVRMNGVFEIVAALLLGCGIYVRPIAFILAIHLAIITSHLGFSAVGVRDFGLSFATLASAFFGDDHLSFTYQREEKKSARV